ncbi:hypothetical protein POM88_047218 [Heracleum sosnowskyi]|uniref:Uncharacterized protein n=1 Tax=Heracleum sosnowskyi TaxID=360622 RepID=A0AAD8GRR1_9APIA|nr:hypothetical protein POM88_047218 [Heracleum sosnowskyi]
MDLSVILVTYFNICACSNSPPCETTRRFHLLRYKTTFINCFLEEPLVCLSSIKDDDLLLIHRREEENPGSSQRRTEWKPYGTPLLSSISCNDTVTRRGDIQSVVHTTLSPLLRTENSRHADVFDSSITASDPPRAVNCTGASTEFHSR